MRIVIYVLLGLILVLVAAILIGPSLIDWNAQKQRIAGQVQDLTGRKLTIDGDMEFTMLPAPALLADGVRFANIEGGQTPFMAELKALRVKVSPLPLLEGRIEIESVALVEPKIFLEVLADGRRNWEVESASSDLSRPDSGADDASGLPGQVRVESFTVANGTLVYRDDGRGISQRVDGVDLEFVADSLTGPFTALGSAQWQGISLSFDAALGRLVRDGAMPLKLELGLPDAKAVARFSGTLSVHRDSLAVRGRLDAGGDDLLAAVRALDPGVADSAYPAQLSQPFSVETNLSGDLAGVSLEALRVKLGEASFTGTAGVVQGPPIDISLALKATRIDIDQWLAAGAPADIADSETQSQPAAPVNQWPLLPENLRARLELTVEGLVYRQQALRQLRFDATLDNRQVTIGEARALLPGGSSLSLTGRLGLVDGSPSFRGRTEASSSNLRALLTWAGLEITDVPPDRLRSMNLQARIEASPQHASLSDLDLKVDLSRVTGGLVVALRQRPGLGIGLSLDTINLDAYLPVAPATATPEDPAPDTVDLAALEAFDANLDLRVGVLTWHGLTAKDLRVDATLDGGTLTVRQASAGDIPGGTASLTGALSDLADRPAFDGTIDVRINDPLRLAKASGLSPEALAQIGPFGLAANLRGTEQHLAVDVKLAALEGHLSFAGPIELATTPPRFEFEAALDHPDLASLLDEIGLLPDRESGLGALAVTGTVAGQPHSLSVSQLAGAAGPLGLSGSFAVTRSQEGLPEIDALDVGVSLSHDSTHQLLRSLGAGDAVPPGFGPVALTGRLTGDQDMPSLNNLTGKVGSIELAGSVSADLTAPRPVLSASLATGELPLSAFGAPADQASAEDSGPNASRWSNTPIDLDVLHDFDGTFVLTSKAWVDEDFRIEGVALNAELRNAVLDLTRVTGVLYGGALQAAGKLDARAIPEIGLAVTVIGLEIREFLKDRGADDQVHGPVGFNFDLNALGESQAAMIAALNGRGTLDGTITLNQTNEQRFGGIVLRFLGNRLKQVSNLAGLTTSVYDTLAGEPARLSGSFKVARGVVSTSDTRLANSRGEMQLTGQSSLPLWQLDSKVQVVSKGSLTKPLITVELTGSLDDPQVALSGISSGRLNDLIGPAEDDGSSDSIPGQDQGSPNVPGQQLIETILEGLEP